MTFEICKKCNGRGFENVPAVGLYVTRLCLACSGEGVVTDTAGRYGPSLSTGLLIGLAIFAIGCALWLVVNLLCTHKLI